MIRSHASNVPTSRGLHGATLMHPSLRRFSRLLTLLGVLISGCLWGTGTAWAHALLVHSDPGADVVLQTAPSRVDLRFTENLNPTASQIVVWDRYRHVMNRGHATLLPGTSRELAVPLKALHAGAYLVLWTSVSADDGHSLHGSYLFFVEHRGPGPSLAGVAQGASSEGFPDAPGLATILVHWIELLAAVCWFGAAACSALVFTPFAGSVDDEARRVEQVRVRTFLRCTLLALIVSSGGVLLLQAYTLAGSWSAVFTSSTLSQTFSGQYAHLWIVRQIMVIGALLATTSMGVAVAVPSREHSLAAAMPVYRRSYGMWIVGILGLAYLGVFAASGHAAAADVGDIAGSSIVSGAVGADWLHFVGDALWFGGQVYLVFILIPALRLSASSAHLIHPFLCMLKRFSPLAYGSIALFVLSGIFAAKIHIPSWYAFFHSVYGWTLVAKISLIGAMMGVSFFTVYVVRPRLRADLPIAESTQIADTPWIARLLVWLRVNPVLGASVMLASSVMLSYPVPLGLSPAGPAGYSFHIGKQSGVLTLKPDRSGPNQLVITLHDAHGHPVRQATAVVLTTMLDMEMGTGKVALTQTGPGIYSGTADLGMGGHWGLRVLVYSPAGLQGTSFKILVGG